MTVLRKAPKDIVTETPLEYVVSTADVDRHGDIVDVSGWDVKEFESNPVCLFNHSPDFVLGRWSTPRVVSGQLRAHLELAPQGTSQRIDEVSTLIRAGIIRTTSVGFIPLESEPHNKGRRYRKQKLIEISMVSIPSNASATLVQAKRVEAAALGIPTASINRIFAESRNATGSERLATAQRKLSASGLTPITAARRAKVLAAKAARDKADWDVINLLEKTSEKIEALSAEIRATQPNCLSGFADWDRHRKLERQLKTHMDVFDTLAKRL